MHIARVISGLFEGFRFLFPWTESNRGSGWGRTVRETAGRARKAPLRRERKGGKKPEAEEPSGTAHVPLLSSRPRPNN